MGFSGSRNRAAPALLPQLRADGGYQPDFNDGRTCGFFLGRNLKTATKEGEGVLITELFSREGSQWVEERLKSPFTRERK